MNPFLVFQILDVFIHHFRIMAIKERGLYDKLEENYYDQTEIKCFETGT